MIDTFSGIGGFSLAARWPGLPMRFKAPFLCVQTISRFIFCRYLGFQIQRLSSPLP
jgi:hypothetical protein